MISSGSVFFTTSSVSVAYVGSILPVVIRSIVKPKIFGGFPGSVKSTIHRITIAAAMTRTEIVLMTPQIIFLIIICFHPLSDLIYHARHCQHLQYQLKYLQPLYDLEVHSQYNETTNLP